MKKKLLLVREIFTDKSTIGKLFFDNEFQCDTLEDTCRKEKIHGETAIPSGTYEVIINFSSRFQRPMPRLLKVPGYEGILIHSGNFPTHTNGCILVGEKDMSSIDVIINSKEAFEMLFPKIETALKVDHLYIDIVGGYSIEEMQFIKKTA